MGPKSLLKITEVESWTLVWDLGHVEKKEDTVVCQGLFEKQQAEMEKILDSHSCVFQERGGLPPKKKYGAPHHP